MAKENPPIFRIKSGALSVSIWEQKTRDGKAFYTCNAQRAYTEDDGQTWQHTSSLDRDDAPVAASLLTQAHAWICQREAKAHR